MYGQLATRQKTIRPLPAPSPIAAKKQFGNQVRRLAKQQYGPGWQGRAFGNAPQKIYGPQRKAYGPPTSQMTSAPSVQAGVTQANRRFQRFGRRLLKSQNRGQLMRRKPKQNVPPQITPMNGGLG